ncbi:MAG: hypothetical protein IPG71_13790 [bacterium]|nr:hypothetical protein [bacterium]
MKLALSFALALLLFGCEDEANYHDDYDSNMTDTEALEELFLEDLDLEEPDVWQDGTEGINAAELRALDEPIEPLAWWRIGHRAGTRVTVEFRDDDHATITRVRRFDGNFRLLVELSDDEMETIDKPMYNNLVRKAHAVRIADSPYPRRNWRIVEITPEVMRSVDPNPNTVQIQNMQVVGANGELVIDMDDPLSSYMGRDELPEIYAGEEVTVYVTVEGPLPAPVGMLRPHVYRNDRLPRLPLKDDGVLPDELAGDGVFGELPCRSARWRASCRRGLHRLQHDL